MIVGVHGTLTAPNNPGMIHSLYIFPIGPWSGLSTNDLEVKEKWMTPERPEKADSSLQYNTTPTGSGMIGGVMTSQDLLSLSRQCAQLCQRILKT